MRYTIAFGLLTTASVAWLASHFAPEQGEQAPLVQVAPVTRCDLRVVVRAIGELDALRSTVISSGVRGDCGKIIYLVEDGKRVEKGDILLRLDPTPFEQETGRLNDLLNEKEALLEARGQLLEWEKNQVHRELKAAEFELRLAELDLKKLGKGEGPLELARLERKAQEAKRKHEEISGYIDDLQNLEKQGFANRTEVDLAGRRVEEARNEHRMAQKGLEYYRDHVLPTSLEKARARVDQARMEIDRTSKGGGFKIGKAEAAVRQAEEELQAANTKHDAAVGELGKTVIRAPIPGMVVLREDFRSGQRRKPRVGDVVWQNQPIMYLPDLTKMVVKSRVREIDLHKVAVGKEAVVRIDAYPDARLRGKVDFIGILAERHRQVRSAEKFFQVNILIEEEDLRLRPGMTARAAIRSEHAVDVLAVPLHAVFREGEKTYCYVRVTDGFARRHLKCGLWNEDAVEITHGLREGESVCLARPPEERILKGEEPEHSGSTAAEVTHGSP